jgi:hypothetical protein
MAGRPLQALSSWEADFRIEEGGHRKDRSGSLVGRAGGWAGLGWAAAVLQDGRGPVAGGILLSLVPMSWRVIGVQTWCCACLCVGI